MQIDQDTRIFGLVGYPLGHSLSPFMHNLAFAAQGINAVYLAFPVKPERVSLMVAAAKTLGIQGFNVTIPYKESLLPFLDKVSPEARACGSVNTVLIKDNLAVGYNTDGMGFMDSLQQEGVKVPRLAVILGAGGAARAVGYQLATLGTVTVFLNRNRERAVNLAREIAGLTGQESRGMSWDEGENADFLLNAELLVNTTPLGMYPNTDEKPILDLRGLNPAATIADIVYNPITTRFLQEAARMGFKTVNGLGMFVNQGVRSWEMFTGQKAPRELMEDKLKSQLEKHEK